MGQEQNRHVTGGIDHEPDAGGSGPVESADGRAGNQGLGAHGERVAETASRISVEEGADLVLPGAHVVGDHGSDAALFENALAGQFALVEQHARGLQIVGRGGVQTITTAFESGGLGLEGAADIGRPSGDAVEVFGWNVKAGVFHSQGRR